VIEDLRTGLRHVGEAPYGSCFQQAAINVLDALGLKEAELGPGLAWGFARSAPGSRLAGSGRWIANLEAECGLRIEDCHADSWAEAEELERAQMKAGLPIIAGVDSFGIPSPQRGRTHLVHAVIVLAISSAEVTYCDPMNSPLPTRIATQDYVALRRSACVERHQMLLCSGVVTRQLDPLAAAAALAADASGHAGSDAAVLDEFSLAAESADPGGLDVAEVAAERLYAAKVLTAAAPAEPAYAAVAAALTALARRWYLLHTLALEARTGRALSRARVAKLLTDLAGRESSARESLAAVAPGAVAEGRVG
jgi:hypothetical protein